jgi:hypothetical protein
VPSSNDQGNDRRKIGNVDAVGGGKNQQHRPINRTVDEDPGPGRYDETDREPSPAAYQELVENRLGTGQG